MTIPETEQIKSETPLTLNSIWLNQALKDKSKADFKKTLEFMILDEEGNVSIRSKFLRDHFPYLEAFLQNKITPPYAVEIQPSSKCNAKCNFCFQYETLKGAKKSKDLLRDERMDLVIKRILEAEAYGLKITSIKFVGSCGDPLVNPKTLDAVDACKKAGRITKLFTNGLGLVYKDSNQVMYTDRLFFIDYMRISLDSGSEHVFNEIKHVEGFYDILKGIERLRKLADQHKSQLHIEIGYVITEKNYNDIYKSCSMVKNAGAHSIRYRKNMIGTPLSGDKLMHVEEKLNKALQESEDNFKVLRVHSEKEFETRNGFSCEKCYVPYFWVTVGSDGLLYPCGHRGGDFGWSIGNLLENDLMTILRSQKTNSKVDELPDSDCKVCPPYAKRLNPFLHYIIQQNGDVPSIKDVIKEVANQLNPA